MRLRFISLLVILFFLASSFSIAWTNACYNMFGGSGGFCKYSGAPYSCFCGGGCQMYGGSSGKCRDVWGSVNGHCEWTAGHPQAWLLGCGTTFMTPEFAPLPGFLVFIASLGIPYWLYFRRKKK